MKRNYFFLAFALSLALVVVGCKKQTSNSQPPSQQAVPGVQQRAQVVQQTAQSSVASRSRILKEDPETTIETYAVVTLRTLNTAEITYASEQPSYEFTCQMANLVSVNQKVTDYLRELRGSYVVTISGCDGPPATKFWITATPVAPEDGRAFCVNEDAVIRYATDGKPESCVGSPLSGQVAAELKSEPQDQSGQRATVQRVSAEPVSQFQILGTQKRFYNSHSNSFFVDLNVRNESNHDLHVDVHWYATDGGVDVQRGNCTFMSVRPHTTAEVECYPLVIGHPNAEIKLGEPTLLIN